MKHTLLIKEEAGHDIADAYKWYNNKRQGIGDEFLTELNEYFAILESDPHLCQVRYKNFRLLPLKRFPYLIVYEIEQKNVIVYSVFHTSKDPKKRLEE